MFNFLKPASKADNQSSTTLPSEIGSDGTPAPVTPADQQGLATPPDETPSSFEHTPIENTPTPSPEPKMAPETQEAPIPAAKPLYPPLPPHKPRRSVLSFLFGPETAVGRFMRPFLRVLATISGLFALGLLAGYILIYQPTQRELDNALLKIKQSNQSISQKDQTLQTAQTNSDQAQQNLKLAQTQLSKAANENGLLVVLVGVSNARVSLVNKDGPAAKAALEQAQADLALIFSYLGSIDQNKADLLKSRLDLAAKELVSDPTAALSDLDKLSVDLNDLHKKLFK